jgi:hypothetical protein
MTQTTAHACYFFGCAANLPGHGSGAGHYWYGPGMRTMLDAALFRFPPGIDCDYAPGAKDRWHAVRDEIEGQANVVSVDGWTILAFWDRSGDQRYGSHAAFVVRGEGRSFDDMVALARASFPELWKRFKFTVKLA